MPDLDSTFTQLADHCRETAMWNSIEALLGWDERTMMPPAAGEYRADQIALMAGMIHRRRTDPILGEWLNTLLAAKPDPHSDRGATARELKRQYDRRVQAAAKAGRRVGPHVDPRPAGLGHRPGQQRFRGPPTAAGKNVPVEARAGPGDRLPGVPLRRAVGRFRAGRAHLATSPKCSPGCANNWCRWWPKSAIAAARQMSKSSPAAIRSIRKNNLPATSARDIGFDFHRGRLDVTTHPFCSTQGPHDCRITTRYDERHFPGAFFGALHEAGHGIYDQGLRTDWYGLPPGEAVSLGIHESQSRMWENLVGRSRSFWQHFYPAAQKAFPQALGKVPLDDFYWAINDVRPSLIRVEADEATYNLHILVRFELEQALVNDDLKVADLPAAWNEKYQHYLGITPPNDSEGVMQDIHWSHGLVGYFPTYSLGNLYAAQFFQTADKELGGLDKQFAAGQFEPLRNWLREKIHRPGQCYTADELVAARHRQALIASGAHATPARQIRAAVRTGH